MTSIILLALGILTGVAASSILVFQHYKIKNGLLTIDPNYNGPSQVSVTLLTIVRFLLKRSVHFRKFLAQYIFHLLVRIMYYIDLWTSYLYAKSRNWFVKNAVRNRGTVPHFWKHLKVYKQEMDREKDETE